MNFSRETGVFIGKFTEMNEFEHISPNGMPSSEGERIFLLPDDEVND